MCMWNIVFIFQTIWKIMFWMWHELGKKQHWLLPFGASKNNTYVQYWLKNQLMWILGCIPLGCSGSGSVIWDLHSDHGTSNEPMNPFPDWTPVVEITVGHRTLSDQNAVNVRLILQWEMRDEENIFTTEQTMTAYVWSRLWTINNKRFFQLNTRGVLLRKIHIFVKHGQHFCWFWEYFQWNKYHHFGSLLFSELNCHNCQNYWCPRHFFSRKSSGEFVYEHVQ